MFGRIYSKYPEILLSSFSQMHDSYKKVAKTKRINNNLFQSIYLSFFGIPEIGFQVRSLYFEKIINQKLKHRKIKSILDAGSGIGTYSFWLAKSYPKAKVYGGDIDQEKLGFSTSFAKKLNVKNISFGYLDVTRKPQGKDRYNLIVSIDVLEHIENYKKVLENFYTLLDPGGYVYIHTPQLNQKRIFKSLQKWEHEGHVHEGYLPQDLKKTLEQAGFKILVLKETFGFFGKLAWELNHMSFKKGFLFSGLTYPLLYVIASIDLLFDNNNGLGTAILAKKK